MTIQFFSEISENHEPAVRADSLHRRLHGVYGLFGKRLFDLALLLLLLPVALPLIVVMAALVAMDGGSPFYRQLRVGRGGKAFHMLKLRTMVPDAEVLLQTYLADNPQARSEWNHHQKLRHDPRITRIGRILRKTSLDELPQLWNVLKGEMSLVGPRPMMLCQRTSYPGSAYFVLRPGISGPWQISERNSSSFAARARYDAGYLDTLSLRGDLEVLVRTVCVVLRGTGC